jgi:hypothetical protein
MGIAIRRFPEHDLTLSELHGVVAGPELLDFLGRLEAAEKTSRWLNYVAPDADLSQLDLMSVTELKRLVGRKVAEAGHEQPFRSIFVSASPQNEPMLKLWADYLGRATGHPWTPQVVSSLEAAYETLDLSPAAREAVSRTLERDSPPCPT